MQDVLVHWDFRRSDLPQKSKTKTRHTFELRLIYCYTFQLYLDNNSHAFYRRKIIILNMWIKYTRCKNNTVRISKWSIDCPSSCPGLHDLRIACLNTYYNMEAILLYNDITDQLSDMVMVIAICIGMTEKRI